MASDARRVRETTKKFLQEAKVLIERSKVFWAEKERERRKKGEPERKYHSKSRLIKGGCLLGKYLLST